HGDRPRRLRARPELGAARAVGRAHQPRRPGARDRGRRLLLLQTAPNLMNTLAPGISYIDVKHLGLPRIIASAVLHGSGGAAIIDPGPARTLPTLRAALGQAGLGIGDVRAILLTHIHLDHAGATGTLVKENPAIRVYVHEKGAPHMQEPEKLIASATRLW